MVARIHHNGKLRSAVTLETSSSFQVSKASWVIILLQQHNFDRRILIRWFVKITRIDTPFSFLPQCSLKTYPSFIFDNIPTPISSGDFISTPGPLPINASASSCPPQLHGHSFQRVVAVDEFTFGRKN